jgi:8-oxo-dGTP pyrophosphatase MutT (NUDIX family)
MTQKRIAVVPVVKKNNRHHVCLVTSRCKRKWIVPTGKPEKHLTNKQVALLEAYEEAGVTGKFDKSFRKSIDVSSPSGRKVRRTDLFLINVDRQLNKWPEMKQRRRIFVDIRKLHHFVCDKKLSRTIQAHLA